MFINFVTYRNKDLNVMPVGLDENVENKFLDK